MKLSSPFTRVETFETCLPPQEAMERVQSALTGDRALHISEIAEGDRVDSGGYSTDVILREHKLPQ